MSNDVEVRVLRLSNCGTGKASKRKKKVKASEVEGEFSPELMFMQVWEKMESLDES